MTHRRAGDRSFVRVPSAIALLASLAVVGCGLIAGIDKLQNVDCVGACDGTTLPEGATVEPELDAATVTPIQDAGPIEDDVEDPTLAPPRPRAPSSTAFATSQQPTLRWELGDGITGARVDVCRRRGCEQGDVIATFNANGSMAGVPVKLDKGTYFWRLRGHAPQRVGTMMSPTWQFRVGARTAPIDTYWGSTPDFNGDGFADVAGGAEYGHAVYVFHGSPTGLAATPSSSLLATRGGEFGKTVRAAGDVNGDGFGDLLVVAPQEQPAGRAYLFFGSAEGLKIAEPQEISPPAGAVAFRNGGAAGDVNGDGYADIVLGAEDSPGPADNPLSQAGRVYVYLGGAKGVADAPATSVFGTTVGARIGFSFGSGDFNGDGFSDIAYGSYATDLCFVHLGGAGGINATPSATRRGPDGGQMGFNMAGSSGDLNGDGRADVVFGALQANSGRGRIYAYYGAATAQGIAAAPSATYEGPVGGNLGHGVAGGCDTNGDGFDEVVPGAGSVSMAFVLRGSAAGLLTMGGTPLSGPASSFFGVAPSCVGDIDGDGFDEVCVGALNATSGVGQVSCYRGGTSGTSPDPFRVLVPPSSSGIHFGSSVATLARPSRRCASGT